MNKTVVRFASTMGSLFLVGLLTLLSGPSRVNAVGGFRIGSWNVLYKALDDVHGLKAITDTIDTADKTAPFSIFGVVEAQGDSPAGALETWSKGSSMLNRLSHVAGTSGYEKIALFYDAERWTVGYNQTFEFEPGRPFLLAQLKAAASASVTSEGEGPAELWVMLVHLNHYFITYPNQIDPVVPGAVMAAAFENASKVTGTDISKASVAILGDFNEYEWADLAQPFRKDAIRRMSPLWTQYFNGRMADAVPPKTVSCCTKWCAADDKSRTEWLFEYDHIFFSDDLLSSPAGATFLPYSYPGVTGGCADPACTGDLPPGNTTAMYQGSWHRAVHTVLDLPRPPKPAATATTTITLNDGHTMPIVNLGTCCGSKPSVGLPVWLAAQTAGLAGVDTAFDYMDQDKIAKVIAGRPRSSIFVTTKLPAGLGNATDCTADPQIAIDYVKYDLAQLGLDHVDLVLLHAPCKLNVNAKNGPVADNALWAGLQAAVKAGLTKSIGVSNYHTEDLLALAQAVLPAVNQIQISINGSFGQPGHDDATMAYCAKTGIASESYGALKGCPWTDPRLNSIAKAHGVSTAQVCLRWVVQRGAIVAVGTGSNASAVGAYTAENLAVFDFALGAADMQYLSGYAP